MSEEINLNQIEELAALPADVASGFAYVSAKNGELVLGEARTFNNSRVELGPGSEYRLPKGYYLENNVIVTASTANSTSATATAADIMLGKTAWVNGVKITGTARGFANLAQSTATSGDILKSKTAYNSNGDQLVGTIETYKADGSPVVVDKGSGSNVLVGYQDIWFGGKFKTLKFKPGYYPSLSVSIPDIIATETTATMDDVLEGKTFISKDPDSNRIVDRYFGRLNLAEKVKETIKANTNFTAEDLLATKKGYNRDGNVVTGRMQNVTNTSAIVLGDSNNSYTIPKGYHDGTGKVIYNSATTAQLTATADNLIYGKTAIGKNGERITGTIINKGSVHVDFGPGSEYVKSYRAFDAYFMQIEIYDYYAEFFKKLSTLSEDVVPTGIKFTDKTSTLKVGKAALYNNQPEVILNGTNKMYTIPKGFHDGNGVVKLKLEKTALPEPEKYKDCTPENTPVNQIYFNQDGEMKTGKLSLATYESHPSGKKYTYTEGIDIEIVLNDNIEMNRVISFSGRTNREIISQQTKLCSLGSSTNKKIPPADPYFQYNKDNSETLYTIFAIPTDVEQWGYKTFDPDKTPHITYMPKSEDLSIRPKDLYTKTPSGTPWFSNMLAECVHSNKQPIIDDIVFKLQAFKSNNPDATSTICKYEFSIPYIPQNDVDTEYLKKCMEATTVLHDGLEYNSKADADNYKIYAVFSSPYTVELQHYKTSMRNVFVGGNFSITFHVYNKRTNNYTYERDPAALNDYVIRQLGVWFDISGNDPIHILPVSISFRNIHMQ